jgi:hypothetical protein
MSNIVIRAIVAAALILSSIIHSSPAFSEDQTEYKKFKLEDASCDVGVRYKNTPQGLMLGVSAIATGKGSEFRKWSVSNIKLRIGNNRIRPDMESNYYVTEESFFRVPGAVVIAAIGFFGEYGGSNFNNTMSKIGIGLGLGLIALCAKGEITGKRCLFNIPAEMAGRIEEGRDNIEITISNDDQHLEDTIKIGVIIPRSDAAKKYSFSNMSEEDILSSMDSLKSRIISLEQEQSGYKYGQDPEFDAINRKIEDLEAERAAAYEAWFEKKNGRDGLQ